MNLEWNDNLVSGIEELDNQHKHLFNLVKVTSKDMNRQTVLNVIHFATTYLQMHLDMEESYMEKFEYPDLEEHKKIHQNIKQKHKEFLLKMSQNSAEAIAPIAKEILDGWIVDHIKTHDAKMIKHIRQHIDKLKNADKKEFSSKP